MVEIERIIDAIRRGMIRISDSVDEEAEAGDLTFDEIFSSVLHGEIIESYPVDKTYPGCLAFGKTFIGNPIHTAWAYNEENEWAVLTTVYRPDPTRWINGRERKMQ
ncbi:MAG: DUF4258 domain-containing protein [Syntrophobacteraceae bacterium]